MAKEIAGKKVLRFGGDALPEGTHTYYQKREADGSATECRADAGQEIELDQIANADYFVSSKRASIVTRSTDSAAPTT